MKSAHIAISGSVRDTTLFASNSNGGHFQSRRQPKSKHPSGVGQKGGKCDGSNSPPPPPPTSRPFFYRGWNHSSAIFGTSV